MRILVRAGLLSMALLSAIVSAPGKSTFAPPAQRFVFRFYGDHIVQVPTTSPLNLGSSFTMECWVYLESASAYSILMGKATTTPYNDPNFQYVLGFADSTRPRFVGCAGQPGSNAKGSTKGGWSPCTSLESKNLVVQSNC